MAFFSPALAATLSAVVLGAVAVALYAGFSRAWSDNRMDDSEETAPAVTSGPGGRPIDSKHYAWAKDIKQREAELAALGVDSTPKPVRLAGEASPAAPVAAASSASSRSVWNAAGTWEDRDISARALQGLRGKLERFSSTAGGATLAVTAVTSCTGTASLA